MKKLVKNGLPALIMAIAVAGAFSTHAMDKEAKKATLVTGYVQLNPAGTSCQANDTECTDVENPVQCTVNHSSSGSEIFQMDDSGRCILPLYQPQG